MIVGVACVVWSGSDGLVCQQFSSLLEAELFATSCEGWAVVVSGSTSDFLAGVSIGGDYMPGVFGGQA